jgi:calcineurin-like phosphoesterase family protein
MNEAIISNWNRVVGPEDIPSFVFQPVQKNPY